MSEIRFDGELVAFIVATGCTSFEAACDMADLITVSFNHASPLLRLMLLSTSHTICRNCASALHRRLIIKMCF
jgi:hypothetical protein